MRRKNQTKTIFGISAVLLTIGVAAWAQNLNVAGQVTASGTGTHSFMGNVGIGTTSPLAKLDVRGLADIGDDSATPDTASYASLGVTRANVAQNNSYIGLTKAGVIPWGIGIDSGTNLIMGVASASPARTIPSALFTLTYGGAVGIGTTSPGYRLDVNGSLHATSGRVDGNLYLSAASNSPYLMYGAVANSYSFGDNNAFYLNINTSSGNVGIGTTTPAQKLDVNGNLNVSGTGSTIAQSGWIAAALQNGWVYYGAPFNTPGYMKDSQGFIHLKGLIASGTAGACAFTLPAGYRPTGQNLFGTVQNSVIGRVDVSVSGCVSPSTTGPWISLDGMTFNTL